MQIKILGCSGGIGGNMRTTSILVDDDVLIDAGTGVGYPFITWYRNGLTQPTGYRACHAWSN